MVLLALSPLNAARRCPQGYEVLARHLGPHLHLGDEPGGGQLLKDGLERTEELLIVALRLEALSSETLEDIGSVSMDWISLEDLTLRANMEAE